VAPGSDTAAVLAPAVAGVHCSALGKTPWVSLGQAEQVLWHVHCAASRQDDRVAL